MNEPLKPDVLERIAKNGVCYTNEARSMAAELIELRKLRDAPKDSPSIYPSIFGFTP